MRQWAKKERRKGRDGRKEERRERKGKFYDRGSVKKNPNLIPSLAQFLAATPTPQEGRICVPPSPLSIPTRGNHMSSTCFSAFSYGILNRNKKVWIMTWIK